jgi:predicted DNA-binding transcriptional regulator AlpA
MPEEIIERLIAALEAIQRPPIPVEVDLWSYREIAAYFKRSESHAKKTITQQGDFPPAIRVAGGHPLWRAAQVVKWAASKQDRR